MRRILGVVESPQSGHGGNGGGGGGGLADLHFSMFDGETSPLGVRPKSVISLFSDGTLIGEGSAAPILLWITNPPFDYTQAESGSLEGCGLGVGHVVWGPFLIPFYICSLNNLFLAT